VIAASLRAIRRRMQVIPFAVYVNRGMNTDPYYNDDQVRFVSCHQVLRFRVFFILPSTQGDTLVLYSDSSA
jgi:hypothetical protein